MILRYCPIQVASVYNYMVIDMNFQFCRIIKYNNRNKREINRTFKQMAKKSYMPLILLYRIIKLVFTFVDDLSPIF